MSASNWWDEFNAKLLDAGLSQQFHVGPQTGIAYYPVPRNEQEAIIFDRILNGDSREATTVQKPDRYYHFP